MKSTPSIHFMECTNPNCGLRFPLDLAQYKGQFCPKCGAALTAQEVRLSPSQTKPEKPLREIVGILDNIRSAYNVGAILRTADGAGFARLYLCGITPTPETTPEITKTALGAQDAIPWEYAPNCPRLLRDLKARGYVILILESTSGAQSLFTLNAQALAREKLALVVGNEPAGVDPALLPLADKVVYLPMAGNKQSLNVSVAFGIAAYQLAFSQLP